MWLTRYLLLISASYFFRQMNPLRLFFVVSFVKYRTSLNANQGQIVIKPCPPMRLAFAASRPGRRKGLALLVMSVHKYTRYEEDLSNDRCASAAGGLI